jgi:hypothetical protein
MSHIKLATMAIACLAVAAFVWASELDELREKAEAMQREAAELAEQGRKREAARLKRKALDMLVEAERLEHFRQDQRKAEIVELNRLLETLRQEQRELEGIAGQGERLRDVRREAERVKLKLRQLSLEPQRERVAPHEEIASRLEHMRIAVDHLKQAGLLEIAEHVAQRAAAAERELRKHQEHHADDVMHEIMRQLDELRHQVERLRDELNELRRRR